MVDLVGELLVLTLERQPPARLERVEAHADHGLADIGVARDEHRPRVLDDLAGFPLRRGNGRIVVVGPHLLLVGVDEMYEGAVVLVELRVPRDREPVSDLDGTAEWRPWLVHRE
jgi:hypothetical protein